MEVKERTERMLERSGRITPREVLEAYEETGLEPTAKEFWHGNLACAVGVLMVRDGAALRMSAVKGWILERGIRDYHGYMSGFYRGFDGHDGINHPSGKPFRLGYCDGRRARRFVFSA